MSPALIDPTLSVSPKANQGTHGFARCLVPFQILVGMIHQRKHLRITLLTLSDDRSYSTQQVLEHGLEKGILTKDEPWLRAVFFWRSLFLSNHETIFLQGKRSKRWPGHAWFFPEIYSLFSKYHHCLKTLTPDRFYGVPDIVELAFPRSIIKGSRHKMIRVLQRLLQHHGHGVDHVATGEWWSRRTGLLLDLIREMLLEEVLTSMGAKAPSLAARAGDLRLPTLLPIKQANTRIGS